MEDQSGGYVIPPKVQLSLYEQYPSLKWDYDVSLLRSAVAEAEGDIVWQRAFDNVLEGVDEMIVDHLSKAFGWTSDRFDSRLLSDIEADQLFGPNSYCWTVKFFDDMTPIN